jgi:hypothetical protein
MLIESKDSGATFAQIGKPPATALGLAIDPQQPNTVYLYGLQFFRSTDGGRTWTALSGAPRPGTSTGNQLLVNPLNSSELLFIRTMTSDAFAARFTSDLTTLVFSTYLGGSADEIVSGMVMGTDGTLYINGHTFSTDFQMAYGSTSAIQSPGSDLFVMKLSGDGAGIAASAFFGGSQNDYPGSPALDNAGNLLFTGYTTSPDYPVTAGALGTQLSSTQNASFFTVLDPNLNLLFSTFLTLGNGSDTFTGALPIPDGRVWLAAAAGSTNLPVTANAVSAQPGGPANAYVMLLDWQH